MRDLSARLEARKIVERAKGKLMDEQDLSEADAFRAIQRAAMRARMSMRDVSNRLLEDGSLDSLG